MQFSVAGWPNTSCASSSTCCFFTKDPKPSAKHAFLPFCLSETEEVIYVLFGYGSLVWRIGSGESEFCFFFLWTSHWVHLLFQIGHTISHTAVNIAGSELRGTVCDALSTKHSALTPLMQKSAYETQSWAAPTGCAFPIAFYRQSGKRLIPNWWDVWYVKQL